jgi:hypothetical protein
VLDKVLGVLVYIGKKTLANEFHALLLLSSEILRRKVLLEQSTVVPPFFAVRHNREEIIDVHPKGDLVNHLVEWSRICGMTYTSMSIGR